MSSFRGLYQKITRLHPHSSANWSLLSANVTSRVLWSVLPHCSCIGNLAQYFVTIWYSAACKRLCWRAGSGLRTCGFISHPVDNMCSVFCFFLSFLSFLSWFISWSCIPKFTSLNTPGSPLWLWNLFWELGLILQVADLSLFWKWRSAAPGSFAVVLWIQIYIAEWLICGFLFKVISL